MKVYLLECSIIDVKHRFSSWNIMHYYSSSRCWRKHNQLEMAVGWTHLTNVPWEMGKNWHSLDTKKIILISQFWFSLLICGFQSQTCLCQHLSVLCLLLPVQWHFSLLIPWAMPTTLDLCQIISFYWLFLSIRETISITRS